MSAFTRAAARRVPSAFRSKAGAVLSALAALTTLSCLPVAARAVAPKYEL